MNEILDKYRKINQDISKIIGFYLLPIKRTMNLFELKIKIRFIGERSLEVIIFI